MPLLTAESLTLGFREGAPALSGIDIVLHRGERRLICGATGSGKTTLLSALAGVIPRIGSIPVFSGRVCLQGRDIAGIPRDELFSRTGYVAQAVEDQLWDLGVEDIIAFPMENRALPRAEIRARVRALMEDLELVPLAGRRVLTLSGGERRMVVLAAALASRPELLILDEPTTGLDPAARGRLCAALDWATCEGRGLIVAEQDPAHLSAVTESVSLIRGGGLSAPVQAASLMGEPAVWREAGLLAPGRQRPVRPAAPPGRDLLRLRGLITQLARADGTPVLDGLDLTLRGGEVLGVIGRNGAGKTTLMKAILGLMPAAGGTLEIEGARAERWTTARRATRLAYVPQTMRQILFHMTVIEEVVFAIRMGRTGEEDAARTRAQETLERYGLGGLAQANPFALSARQQGQLGLACADATGAPVAIIDEPLLARDLQGRHLLETFLERMTLTDRAVMLISHDLELVDDVATRLAVVAGGTIAFDGALAEGWASPAFRALGWGAPCGIGREGAAWAGCMT
ncbi:ATP-binding cassette domain-containing protein [Paroceanicella profunda]|uniref:ATP-binding cassette domain-containing protein n=1 Tax=Paroceanicella profunda TaxID=2579971 RepID=A0A5B8G0H6_9RHOB|nr:ATP-binding cassette domain-containing protein [Paroceanicella profunda]QDL93250.1 ATP-binding cassette domain-containing protein [Paroceanicella profunda]